MSAPPRVELQDGRVAWTLTLAPPEPLPAGATLTLDIYAKTWHVHPEGHLGWWQFALEGTTGELQASLQLQTEADLEVQLTAGDRPLRLSDHWFNPDFVWEPAQDVDLVIREGDHPIDLDRLELAVLDQEMLQKHYSQDTHQDRYVPVNVFGEAFHESRLANLTHYFRKYLADTDRVLDVGSGYSMFHLTSPDWKFDVTCCDLDHAAMEKMRVEAPHFKWVEGDAMNVPFADEEFDAVFAGEVIEHVPDPRAALTEWLRVLKPGGVLILTTPNKDRMVNRINKEHVWVNPEHISEMSYSELKSLFADAGLKLLACRGIYLEFLFNYLRRGKKVDLLPARFNRPRYKTLLRGSMFLGRLMPSRAFDLIFVLRKPER